MTRKTTTPKPTQPTTSVAQKTPADIFRDSLTAKGITLKDWAEERNYNPEYCSRVLCGLVKANVVWVMRLPWQWVSNLKNNLHKDITMKIKFTQQISGFTLLYLFASIVLGTLYFIEKADNSYLEQRYYQCSGKYY